MKAARCRYVELAADLVRSRASAPVGALAEEDEQLRMDELDQCWHAMSLSEQNDADAEVRNLVSGGRP
jgi:hypothetical protein